MSTPSPWRGRARQVWAWSRRRSGAMLSSALRGAAYASGAGAVGLIFWWIRQKL
ncbi:hypothetical protein [Streptomyces cellostaticus]|uniref:hypothetical protein n=1 Tax=Streptomyces cellostaticus TaxID=67285 RepID=UPI000A8C8CB1|nr:hypothetical protein [Streptomyces cellostaticus]